MSGGGVTVESQDLTRTGYFGLNESLQDFQLPSRFPLGKFEGMVNRMGSHEETNEEKIKKVVYCSNTLDRFGSFTLSNRFPEEEKENLKHFLKLTAPMNYLKILISQLIQYPEKQNIVFTLLYQDPLFGRDLAFKVTVPKKASVRRNGESSGIPIPRRQQQTVLPGGNESPASSVSMSSEDAADYSFHADNLSRMIGRKSSDDESSDDESIGSMPVSAVSPGSPGSAVSMSSSEESSTGSTPVFSGSRSRVQVVSQEMSPPGSQEEDVFHLSMNETVDLLRSLASSGKGEATVNPRKQFLKTMSFLRTAVRLFSNNDIEKANHILNIGLAFLFAGHQIHLWKDLKQNDQNQLIQMYVRGQNENLDLKTIFQFLMTELKTLFEMNLNEQGEREKASLKKRIFIPIGIGLYSFPQVQNYFKQIDTQSQAVIFSSSSPFDTKRISLACNPSHLQLLQFLNVEPNNIFQPLFFFNQDRILNNQMLSLLSIFSVDDVLKTMNLYHVFETYHDQNQNRFHQRLNEVLDVCDLDEDTKNDIRENSTQKYFREGVTIHTLQRRGRENVFAFLLEGSNATVTLTTSPEVTMFGFKGGQISQETVDEYMTRTSGTGSQHRVQTRSQSQSQSLSQDTEELTSPVSEIIAFCSQKGTKFFPGMLLMIKFLSKVKNPVILQPVDKKRALYYAGNFGFIPLQPWSDFQNEFEQTDELQSFDDVRDINQKLIHPIRKFSVNYSHEEKQESTKLMIRKPLTEGEYPSMITNYMTLLTIGKKPFIKLSTFLEERNVLETLLKKFNPTLSKKQIESWMQVNIYSERQE